MEKLQSASFLTSLFSRLFPKKLEVELHTQTLSDGNIEVLPIYRIAGKIVPPELVTASEHQQIMGHAVTAGPDVTLVQREIGTKCRHFSKQHAADFISRMSHRGVKLRSKGKSQPPQVQAVKPQIELHLNPDDSLKIRSQLTTAKGMIVEKPTSLEELQKEEGWIVADGDFYHVETTESPIDEVVFTGNGETVLTGQDVPKFLKETSRHGQKFSTIEKNPALEELAVYGEQHKNFIHVQGDETALRINPALVYFGKDGQPYQPMLEGHVFSETGDAVFNRIPEGWLEVGPDVVAEHHEAVSELREKIGALEEIKGANIPLALTTLLRPENLSTPWAVYFSDEVKNSHRIVETPANAQFQLNVVDSDGSSLLELDPRYNHDRFRLSHAEISAAAENDEEWIRRDNAWVKIDRRRFDRVEKAVADLGLQRTSSGFQFPASRREQVVETFSRLGSIEHTESYTAFLQKLADFEKIEAISPPTSLRPQITFRPYQQHGYNWLAFLRRFGLNGILADDMGLGKTLQTLAAIRREQERTGTSLPSLVICPTSLIANWKQEAMKFFKGFQVHTYTGPGRAKVIQELNGSDTLDLFSHPNGNPGSRPGYLVITSFGIALRDQEQLSSIPWLYVVVDEAHQIKNPSAKRTRAIKTINGQHKLALTGTPIQNNLDELWSLFDFVMPGYLGTRGKFREQYGHGNKVNWDAVRDSELGLRRRINPFVLRRLKEDVAKDLPEKVVINQPIELAPLQVKLYREALESVEFQKLVKTVEEKGANRASTEILALYTRLRTICNHPALVSHATDGAIRFKDSGKLEALKELMEEIREGSHRTLLFCQSTKMLDIIGQFFQRWNISYLRLDGTIPPPARQGLVDQFNGDVSLTAFLLSTKVGSTGLNLTGADTVIFYDHDWNPAYPNQGEDRAYRIGQTKNVTVYKLISVGTIEDKIIERQGIKQSLAEELIGADRDGFKELSKEELLSLFQFRE